MPPARAREPSTRGRSTPTTIRALQIALFYAVLGMVSVLTVSRLGLGTGVAIQIQIFVPAALLAVGLDRYFRIIRANIEEIGAASSSIAFSEDNLRSGDLEPGVQPNRQTVVDRGLHSGGDPPPRLAHVEVDAGILQNITGLKEALDALQRSEQKYREIFNATSEAIFVHDAVSGDVLDVNDAVLRLYGFASKEQVLAQINEADAGDPIYSNDEARRRVRQAAAEGPRIFEWRAYRSTGEPFWAEVSLRTSDVGGERRVLAVLRDVTERKRAEQTAKQREEQLQLFIRHSPAAIAMFDRDMRYLIASERWMSDYQLGDQHIVGRSHYDVFPDLPEHWRPVHQRCLAGAVEKNEAEAFRRADGSVDWVRWEVRPWHTDEGAIGGIIIFSEVVTARRQAEEALRESESNFRTMFQVASVGMAEADPITGRWLRVNWKMCEITGYSPHELLSMRFSEMTHPDDRAFDWDVFQRALSESLAEYHLEKRYIRKDGATVWVSVNTALTRRPGGGVRAMAAVEDITERRRTEELLQLQSAALGAAANAIAITDRDGVIQWANPAMTRATGYALDEMIGQNFRLLKSGRHDEAFYRNLWNTILAGHIWHGEVVNRRKDGTFSDEEVTITPMRAADGSISHFIAIRQDVAERKSLQEQLLQAQKMEAIGRLAGGVAHDFNNILSVIIMQAEMAAEPDSPLDEARNGLRQIRAAAERAANLTRQLLLFSRKQVMQARDLDVNEVVAGLAKMLRRIIGEDVRLQLDLHPSPLVIHADPGMLDQMLLNLAVNARDAMPSGGQLRIETGRATIDDPAAEQRPDLARGCYARIRVSDSGGGIPPEALPHIFEPFFTTKAVGKGTGLGLATVFGVVKQHRGWIDVESRPEEGARFDILLPTVDAPASAEPAKRSQPRGGSETILLAEDEDGVRLLTRRTLERAGYTVLEAASGHDAMEVWRSGRDRIALLLTDMVMPGMSGPELARTLVADRPALKVVLMSGYAGEAANGSEPSEGSVLVQKPCAPQSLLDVIRSSLDA